MSTATAPKSILSLLSLLRRREAARQETVYPGGKAAWAALAAVDRELTRSLGFDFKGEPSPEG